MRKEFEKYILVFVFCLFVFPLITHAECSYQRQAELSKLASNVQISYNYEVIDNKPSFSTNISNVTNDIYLVDDFGNVIMSDGVYTYGSTTSINYTVYSNDNNCKGAKLVTKNINLPIFNDYSQYEECKNNPDLDICSVWGNYYHINEKQFEEMVGEETISKMTPEIDGDKSTLLTKVIDFIQLYWVIIVSCIAFLLTIVSILWFRRRKK